MNRKEQVKQILRSLLETGHGLYVKSDIEKAIMENRGVDPRTRRNWFEYLWRMEYLVQPKQGVYAVNFEKVPGLEELRDEGQRRLYNV